MQAAELQTVKDDQKKEKDAFASSREKVSVIEERTKRTEQDVNEIKEGQKEQSKKLDELLRRVR